METDTFSFNFNTSFEIYFHHRFQIIYLLIKWFIAHICSLWYLVGDVQMRELDNAESFFKHQGTPTVAI